MAWVMHDKLPIVHFLPPLVRMGAPGRHPFFLSPRRGATRNYDVCIERGCTISVSETL